MTIPSSVRHSLARAGRLLVAGTCVAVAAWALITVGLRMFHAYRRQHDGRIHLTVLQWGDATETDGFRRLLARFEDLHPGVNVMVLNTALFDRKLFTMIAGNMSPDVFYVTADNLSIWANSGLLLNLDPWLAKDPGGPGTAPLSDYYPRLLEWFQFDGRQEGKGPRYALPAYHSPRFMIVNKALFARAGVRVPYDGWNWEEYKETLLRISALTEPGSTGRVYGGAFSAPTELASLFSAIANNGGQLFLDQDPLGEAQLGFGEPAAQEILDLVQRGRFVDGTIVIPGGDSLQTARTDLGALFIAGRVGVLGPTRYAANTVKALADINLPFDWDIVPLPHRQRAKESITGVVGWGVSARTKHPEAAVALLRFMAGPEVQAALAAQGRIMPTLRSVARSDAFLHLPGRPENRNLLLELSEKSKLQRWPRLLRFTYIFREEISENALQLNRVTAAEAARRFQSAWDAERASSRNRPAGELISWRPVIGGTLALCLALLAWGTWQSRRVWRHRGRRGEALAGLGFASPWLAGFVLFTGGPILVSLILSFTQWSPLTSLSEARWAGWSNYKEIFWEDRTTWQAFSNTLYFAALVVPPTQVGALGLALLLTARLRAVAFFRTVFFVPSLVTGVALATLGFMFFSAKYGLVNAVLTPLLKPFGTMPPDWLNVDAGHWGFPALVLLAMWGMGGAMVIYIAALKNVPAELYEAAQMEGAGPWQRFCKVTLPLISPILQFNFVMGLINSFHVFGLVLIMTRGGPNHATEVVALRIYNFAFESLQMGYASAMAWLLLLLTLFLTFCALRLSSSRIHYENLR